ncbi:MAG: UDP-N-acetylglucosamine 2-epimerase (hydrolyzing) [Lachnospiraceae bacterium]|nr:UDP-N-acetylglucosamine 2-epimerase (hydrolyzing) [Lachnospiraceae bacterium]
MIKICIATMTRSEYGILKWLIKDLIASNEYDITLLVGGAHFSEEQGYTVDEIKADGIPFFPMENTLVDTTDDASIVRGMGNISIAFSTALSKLAPDYLIVEGDRYELIPIVSGALMMKIPVIHISGGDVTEGAIDNEIRNAITMMSTYHFVGNQDSKENVIRMQGSDKNVWNVGEPGLDSFFRERLFSREELAENLGLDINKKWVLFTYHPESKMGLEDNLKTVRDCLDILMDTEGIQCVATYANMDMGGREINDILEEYKDDKKIIVIPSLGHTRYLSMMKQAGLVLGNSSSGIVEAPILRVPVVNVGERQKGRHLCGNVVHCDNSKASIKQAVEQALDAKLLVFDADYWGDGHAAKRIQNVLSSIVEK